MRSGTARELLWSMKLTFRTYVPNNEYSVLHIQQGE